MPMKNPPHPGGFVFRQCIEPLGLTITDAAAALGVTRTTLSELVNGKRGILTRNGGEAVEGLRQ
jgi:addiction module HigA family antidote